MYNMPHVGMHISIGNKVPSVHHCASRFYHNTFPFVPVIFLILQLLKCMHNIHILFCMIFLYAIVQQILIVLFTLICLAFSYMGKAHYIDTESSHLNSQNICSSVQIDTCWFFSVVRICLFPTNKEEFVGSAKWGELYPPGRHCSTKSW